MEEVGLGSLHIICSIGELAIQPFSTMSFCLTVFYYELTSVKILSSNSPYRQSNYQGQSALQGQYFQNQQGQFNGMKIMLSHLALAVEDIALTIKIQTVGSLVLGLKATTMGPRRELAGISVIFNGLHQVLEVRVAKTAPSQHQHNSPRVLHPPPQPMSGCLLISEKAIILSDL